MVVTHQEAEFNLDNSQWLELSDMNSGEEVLAYVETAIAAQRSEVARLKATVAKETALLQLAEDKLKIPVACQQLADAERMDIEATKKTEAISNRISAQWSFRNQICTLCENCATYIICVG